MEGISRVRSSQETVPASMKQGTPKDEELEELGEKIAGNWKKLGRRLDINDPKLHAIHEAHDQLSEKGYHMLKHWKQEKGSAATYQALCDALKHKLVQRQDLAEQFCYIHDQEGSSRDISELKRKSLEPIPERGNLPLKISCIDAISRNSKQQGSQDAREKVNRYMRKKVETAMGKFDLSSDEGLLDFHAYLVGHLHVRVERFEYSSIKITVKCHTTEILERLWEDYRSGHLNAVAEECLITGKVKDELDMETITLTTTILEDDYLACKQSLMEISVEPSADDGQVELRGDLKPREHELEELEEPTAVPVRTSDIIFPLLLTNEMAAAPDPGEAPRSTSGKENFQRVTRLLIGGGTTLLREIFDLRCPPKNLSRILRQQATKNQLKSARLTKPQWDCLYPSPGVYGKSSEFDVTLLFKLLRTICSLSPPVTGWDALPTSTDHSLTADLARIKYYRNSVYGHVKQNMEITDDEFSLLWQEISVAFVRVAGQISHKRKTKWQGAIDNLLKDPLTAEAERNVKELLNWYRNDRYVKKSVKELKSTTQKQLTATTHLGEQLNTTTQDVQEGMECLKTNLNGGLARLEGELGEVNQSIAKLNCQTENSRSPAARVRLRIDCKTISGPGQQGGSSEIEVTSQEHGAGVQLTAVVPIASRKRRAEAVGGIPTKQEVLNLAASKYLQRIDPSKPEDLNGFVYYLEKVRKVRIVDTRSGSLIITVECSSLEILEGLWEDYCTGYFIKMAQKYLVTDDILKELGLTEVKLTTTILEEEYRACREHLLQYSEGLRLGDMATGADVSDNASQRPVKGLDQTLQAGVEAELILCPRTPEGEISHKPDLNQIEVLIEPTKDVTDVNVSEEENGEFKVNFTPKVPGAYSIELKINGNKLPTCPFTMQVKERELVVVGELDLKLNEGDKLQEPYGIALNTKGNIAITDVNGHSVYIFDKEGICLRKIGSHGGNAGQFNYPRGVTYLNDNEIVIADAGHSRIQHVNVQTGTFVRSFGKRGTAKGEFSVPCDVCLDEQHRILVTERFSHRIQVITQQGETISIFGDSGPEKLDNPTRCIPYKNMFLVSDGGNDCIKVFDQSGTFSYTFGKQGNQDGQFNWPHGMLVDRSSNLLVCDRNSNRVQQFTLDGRFTGKTVTHLPDPTGIATAPDGRILVTSGIAKKVYILK